MDVIKQIDNDRIILTAEIRKHRYLASVVAEELIAQADQIRAELEAKNKNFSDLHTRKQHPALTEVTDRNLVWDLCHLFCIECPDPPTLQGLMTFAPPAQLEKELKLRGNIRMSLILDPNTIRDAAADDLHDDPRFIDTSYQMQFSDRTLYAVPEDFEIPADRVVIGGE